MEQAQLRLCCLRISSLSSIRLVISMEKGAFLCAVERVAGRNKVQDDAYSPKFLLRIPL